MDANPDDATGTDAATDRDADEVPRDVVIVGGGVAGLTAGIYAARAGLDTLVVRGDESLLRRNAHLENVPGFPAGVNPRTFLDMTEAQAERAGCAFRDAHVTAVRPAEDDRGEGFVLALADGDAVWTARVVAATKNAVEFLDGLDVDLVDRGSKTYVAAGEGGRTNVPGLYAAGRLAERPHQTAIAAGHGAEVALAVVADADVPYYHDWVAPEGYFTGRGREVPPGCEEITGEERRRREEESLQVMREWFAEPHPAAPTPHPSLVDDEDDE